MEAIKKLYTKGNYTIQKSVAIEDKLYTELKGMTINKYNAKVSDIINVCIEELIENNDINDIKYYKRPYGEILIYRSIMIRKENLKALEEIKDIKGITITRLINLAIKEFIEKQKIKGS
ncbi:MAG: hypothetical protein HFJ24_07480 [Clostridia bacterium]|nr:hypothetical protein [Clostridia bacterium]